MTQDNQKIFDGMIERLERQRLNLFRSAAQLDNTIQQLRIDAFTNESIDVLKWCINERMTYREAFLMSAALPRDETSEEIMNDALDNFIG